ncbi:MAG TPA: LLM class flavin-dependent oxidoreductase [Chloroflexia bacterium]|nr:LLM class flavin-dependent oxidoreductase [Chloroflexia bacterium]
MPQVQFGWAVSVQGVKGSQNIPIAITQQAAILPFVAQHFGSVWVYDHFFGIDRPSRPWLEGWTTLTWLAARFPTLQVGTLVLSVGYRNPALVAKMAATLQTLSGGRLVLGIGAGWREEEYRAYGYPFPAAGVRRQQLEEAVEIIRRMWAEPAPSFQGAYFSIQEAFCEPRPDPPPTLMIGSTGEKILPLVARHADWWDSWFFSAESIESATYRQKRDLLDHAAEAIGRDPAGITRSVSSTGCVLPESAADSARWVALLRPFVELGVTRFMFDFGHVPSTEPIARFAAEVIAPLNQA